MSKGLRWATWFLSNPIIYDYVESHPIDKHIKPLRLKKYQKYFSMLKIFEVKKCKQNNVSISFSSHVNVYTYTHVRHYGTKKQTSRM